MNAICHHPQSRRDEAGLSIAEALISAALASTVIAALCMANAACLGLVKAHKETLAVTQRLNERIEQFRSANWSQITDAKQVQTLVAQTSTESSFLTDHVEQVTISTYPPVVPDVAPIKVSRSANGQTSIVSQPPSGFSLRNALAVRIDVRESWTSRQGKRPRLRESSTVVALGGLLK